MMADIVLWKSDKLKVSPEGYDFTPRPILLVGKVVDNLQVSVIFYSTNYFELHFSWSDKAMKVSGMLRINYRSKDVEERISQHHFPKYLMLAFVEIFEYLRNCYPELYNYVKVADDYLRCILIGGVEV